MLRLSLALPGCLCLAVGCGSPHQRNIELAKENQDLKARVEQLQKQRDADRNRIEALERQVGTVPTLSQQRLDRLATVTGVEIGRFSGAADLDPRREGHEGLKVYIRPMDAAGTGLKATGTVIVEAFNLGVEPVRVGRWEVGPDQIKDTWRELGPLEGFVLSLPWQKVPPDGNISFTVTFTDELTGRRFEEVRRTVATLPAAPATQPIARP
jgi:outer membrane murein-binding lipoprotein Lpp